MDFANNIIQIKNTFTEEQIINAIPEKITPKKHTLEFDIPFVAVFIINERIEKIHTSVKEMFDTEYFSDENNEIIKRFKIIYADFNTKQSYALGLLGIIMNLVLTIARIDCETQSGSNTGSEHSTSLDPGSTCYCKMFELRNLYLKVLNHITELEEEMCEFCSNPNPNPNPDSSF